VGPVARIVVGVDASPGARRALAWAAAEARLRGAVLQVVHAYQARHLAAPFYFPSQHAVPATTEDTAMEPAQLEMAATMQDRAEFEEVFRSRAEQVLDTLLAAVDGAVGDVEVRRTVIEDRHPAEALVSLSADADLLVVGSRGLGGFTEMLLGSVSHAAVLHAVCPVVVIPSHGEERLPGQPSR
jgi:nucleotide-binding universal stress UspA family protein